MADSNVKLIWVASTRTDNRVALWDIHPDHPADEKGRHEVFISTKEPVQVAETAAVLGKLRSGELRRVDTPKADQSPQRAAAAPVAEEPDQRSEPGAKLTEKDAEADKTAKPVDRTAPTPRSNR